MANLFSGMARRQAEIDARRRRQQGVNEEAVVDRMFLTKVLTPEQYRMRKEQLAAKYSEVGNQSTEEGQDK